MASSVALLAEGVDRNSFHDGRWPGARVALLAEGVDRNKTRNADIFATLPVALLAEGVDRNWKIRSGNTARLNVALLAEGVDRNTSDFDFSTVDSMSPSSRRAWIEIVQGRSGRPGKKVALLAEGVDRNRSGRR